MGTFHQNRGELHGVTVIVETAREVWVGRCDTADEQAVFLLDADVHHADDAKVSREQFLRRASEVGVWARHPRVVIPRSAVVALRRLG